MNTLSNPFVGIFIDANEATSKLLAYAILLIIFLVSAYVIQRKTQDIAKSAAMSLYISTTITLIIYYMGKVIGVPVVHDLFFYSEIMFLIALTGILYYQRHETG